MTDKTEGRFEGTVLTKLGALETRLDDVHRSVHAIQGRCVTEQTAHATLAAELRALREKTNFLTRALWGAVAWVLLSVAGMLLAVVQGTL